MPHSSTVGLSNLCEHVGSSTYLDSALRIPLWLGHLQLELLVSLFGRHSLESVPLKNVLEVAERTLLYSTGENKVASILVAKVAEGFAQELFLRGLARLSKNVVFCSDDSNWHHTNVQLVPFCAGGHGLPVFANGFLDFAERSNVSVLELSERVVQVFSDCVEPEIKRIY